MRLFWNRRKTFSFTIILLALISLTTATGSLLAAQTEAPDMPGSDVSHNTWTSGSPIPVPVVGAAFGVIAGKIYVVSGATTTTIVNDNQVYDPATNKWSTGQPIPTARYVAASAVVNNILYVIGGCTAACAVGSGAMTVVEAYDPVTNSWATKSPIPIANGIDSVYAIASNNIIYVVGGYVPGSGRVPYLYAYNPATDSWAQLASMKVGRSNPMLGVLGGIVVAGGLGSGGIVTDFEVYNPTKKTWTTSSASLPAALAGSCFGVISGQFYVAGGAGGNEVQESAAFAYSPKSKSWNTNLAAMPQATIAPASGVVGGKLFCVGGANNGNLFPSVVYPNVQIYQP